MSKTVGSIFMVPMLIALLVESQGISANTKVVNMFGAISDASGVQLYTEKATLRNGRGPLKIVGVNYLGLQLENGPNDVWSYADNFSLYALNYGLNVVRLPFYWNDMEISSSPDDFEYNLDYLERYVEAVRIFTSHGLYVIPVACVRENPNGTKNLRNFLPIDLSNWRFKDAFFTDQSSTSGRAHLKCLWLQVTSYELHGYSIRNDPRVAGYDLLNEPHHSELSDSGSNVEWQQLHDEWYAVQDYVILALRENGDQRIIFIEETPWAGTMRFMTRTFDYSNIAYTIHFYAGLEMRSGEGLGYAVVNNTDGYLRDQYYGYGEIGDGNQFFPDVPFLVLEFGNLYSNEINDDSDIWIQNALVLFNESGLAGWVYFAMGNTKNGGQWSNGTFVQRLQESMKGS